MEYVKENLIIDIDESDRNVQLLQSIVKTQKELKKAHSNFEFAETELVDFYTYQIKALQAKLDYLTRLAKIKKIDFNLLNEKAV